MKTIDDLLGRMAVAVKQWRDDISAVWSAPPGVECGSHYGDEYYETDWSETLDKAIEAECWASALEIRIKLLRAIGRALADDFMAEFQRLHDAARNYSPRVDEEIRRHRSTFYEQADRLANQYVEAGHAAEPEELFCHQSDAIKHGDLRAMMATLEIESCDHKLKNASDYWGALSGLQQEFQSHVLHTRCDHGYRPAEAFLEYLKAMRNSCAAELGGLLEAEQPEPAAGWGDNATSAKNHRISTVASALGVSDDTIMRRIKDLGEDIPKQGNAYAPSADQFCRAFAKDSRDMELLAKFTDQFMPQ